MLCYVMYRYIITFDMNANNPSSKNLFFINTVKEVGLYFISVFTVHSNLYFIK